MISKQKKVKEEDSTSNLGFGECLVVTLKQLQLERMKEMSKFKLWKKFKK